MPMKLATKYLKESVGNALRRSDACRSRAGFCVLPRSSTASGKFQPAPSLSVGPALLVKASQCEALASLASLALRAATCKDRLLDAAALWRTLRKMTTPGVEPGLSRPRRDVLTTRRCGRLPALYKCKMPKLTWKLPASEVTANVRPQQKQ